MSANSKLTKSARRIVVVLQEIEYFIEKRCRVNLRLTLSLCAEYPGKQEFLQLGDIGLLREDLRKLAGCG
jgi:hypothetical protein